jgi:phenylacetic acid degradation operon negative regulatory protein
VTAEADLGLEPLTARSVLLSVLLGSHPPVLAVRTLVRTAELFGISEGAARVALSRLGADGDVVADGGKYQLSPRLLERQTRQDSWLRPATRPWRGAWETAVASPERRGPADRAALGDDMARLRLAELRPGVWIRPDNLMREWPKEVAERAWRFESRPRFDVPPPRVMVAQLWDLGRWASTAQLLIETLEATHQAAGRFVIGAAMVRHLGDDPVLPPSLLPRGWPGSRLRSMYRAYRREVGDLLGRQRARHDGPG